MYRKIIRVHSIESKAGYNILIGSFSNPYLAKPEILDAKQLVVIQGTQVSK